MNDKDQGAVKRKELADLIDAVMDSPDQLTPGEIDDLYRQSRPGEDPRTWLRAAASKVAQSYRLRKEKVPYHVQAVLEATKSSSTEEGWSPSGVMDLVNSLLSGATPSGRLPAGITPREAPEMELSEKDRAILEELSDELRKQKDNTE